MVPQNVSPAPVNSLWKESERDVHSLPAHGATQDDKQHGLGFRVNAGLNRSYRPRQTLTVTSESSVCMSSPRSWPCIQRMAPRQNLHLVRIKHCQ